MSRLFSCHLFPWTSPLLPQLVDFLLQQSTTDIPRSLDHLLIITPTRQAGRRLLETLTQATHQQNQGLLPPSIFTPDVLLHRACPASSASRILAQATWAELLRENKEALSARLSNPHLPDDLWTLQTARQLEHVQSQVGMYGLDFAQIAAQTAHTPMDAARWQLFAELEAEYRQRLQQMGKLCPQAARKQAASNPVLPPNIRHILLASPNPSPLVIQLLQTAQQQGINCTVLQYGPDTPEAWNEYGLPNPEFWYQRNLQLTDTHSFHVSYDPHELASTLHERLCSLSTHTECAIGIPDTQLIPAIEQELASREVPLYNPAGQELQNTEVGRLLLAIQSFLQQSSFYAIWNLLRHPAFHQGVFGNTTAAQSLSPQSLLYEVDRLEERHLCHSMDALREVVDQHTERFPLMSRALPLLEDWLRMAQQASPEHTLEYVLLQLMGERKLIPANPQDRVIIHALQELNNILLQLQELRQHYPEMTQATVYSLLGSLLQETVTYSERPADDAIDLQGWLETLWEPAPALILAGMHNQALPSHVQGDAYLPEQLREHLGMETNRQRAGMDAYLLHAVLECRSEQGHVDMLLCRWNINNQITQPSPLLLHTDDDGELLRRVQELIQYQPPLPTIPQRNFPQPVHLIIPEDTEKRIPITAFKQWLENPFDFFLQQHLGWKVRPHRKREMDGADIGTLIHRIMERCLPILYQEKPAPKSAETMIETHARQLLEEQYGKQPGFLLELQWDNIRRRLHQCVRIELEQMQQGWAPLHMEQTLRLELNGYQLEGRVDRIDYHQSRNMYRIIDYKTGASKYAFSKKIVAGSAPLLIPEAGYTVLNNKGNEVPYRWTDLQLPLYLLAAQRHYQLSALPEACIFYIPAKPGGIDLQPITLDERMVSDAVNCASAILRSIDNQQFWAGKESIRFPQFFPDGVHPMFNLTQLSFPESPRSV